MAYAQEAYAGCVAVRAFDPSSQMWVIRVLWVGSEGFPNSCVKVSDE